MSRASLPATGAGGHGQGQPRHGAGASEPAAPVAAAGSWQAAGGGPGGGPAATATALSAQTAPAVASSPAAKPRSCITCRQRKVRCDKLSPCSNCRRADIQCVFPSLERPPRWARRIRQQQQQQQQEQEQQQEQQQEQKPPPPPQKAKSRQHHRKQPLLTKETSPSTLASSPHALSATSQSMATGTATEPEAHTDVSSVLERLRNLEDLVRELSRSSTTQAVTPGGKSVSDSSGTTPAAGSRSDQGQNVPVQERLGRLILDDDTSSRSRYVSSGFWSKINDELDDIRAETVSLTDEESSNVYSDPDEEPGQRWTSTGEMSRPPEERHAFLFGGHDLAPAFRSMSAYRPLPSQIPFLYQVFLTNVNSNIQVIHVPTVRKMITEFLESTGAEEELSLANEALMFAIFYAAVASMGEEEVTRNFASPKAELILKFRRGIEVALARADFLNTTDIVLVQALTIFLIIVRRYDSPRFVWMMTGLAVRMGLALGLQRDGSSFGNSLTPYQVEIRRRVWWALIALDVRSSEDQGAELTIAPDSFSTQLPLNINDDDLSESSTEMPVARQELTDMTHTLLNIEMLHLTQKMMALAGKAVKQEESGSSDDPEKTQEMLMAEHGRMLEEIYERLDAVYLQYTPNRKDVAYWVGMTCTHLFLSKMTLIVYLPTFLRSHDARTQEQILDAKSEENSKLRCRLLNCAIEVAEFFHALNVEPASRHLRWIFETYTQWHSIAYLLIETGREPWDPTVERAWVALHSPYLIPAARRYSLTGQAASTPSQAATASTGTGGAAQKGNSKGNNSDSWTQLFWLPMRKMMAKARRHRAAELARLRVDTLSARSLDIAYETMVARGHSYPLSNPDAVDLFRDRWRKLVGLDSASPAGQSSSLSGTASGSGRSTSKSTPPALSAVENANADKQPGNPGGWSKNVAPPVLGDASGSAGAAANNRPIFPSTSSWPVDSQQQILYGDMMSRNLYDPWPVWGGPETMPSITDHGDGLGNASFMMDNNILDGDNDMDMDLDMDMNMGIDSDIDWGSWFASIRDFERVGTRDSINL